MKYTIEIYRHQIDNTPTVYKDVFSFKLKKDYLVICQSGVKILVNVYEITEIIIREQNNKSLIVCTQTDIVSSNIK
jgi:hypothetical protein